MPIRTQHTLWALLLVVVLSGYGGGTRAEAQSDVFTTIDVAGAINTFAYGINNLGDVVGYYTDSPGRKHGYLLSGGEFTQVDFPGAHDTEARSVNDAGDIVGYLWNDRQQEFHFLFHGGQFGSFGAPDTRNRIEVFQVGINNGGDIVGTFTDFYATGGFLYTDYLFSPPFVSYGTFTPIDIVTGQPRFTRAHGINNSREVVGSYSDIQDGQPRSHGFVLGSDDGVNTIDFPGVRYTFAYGVNDSDDVVGYYAASGGHGFLLSGGQFVTIDFPDATRLPMVSTTHEPLSEPTTIWTIVGTAFFLASNLKSYSPSMTPFVTCLAPLVACVEVLLGRLESSLGGILARVSTTPANADARRTPQEI